MTGYVRQSAAEIVTGEIVLALPLNNEFNALQSAFNSTTGHTHDGTTGNGPKISLSGSVSGKLPISLGGTNATTEQGARTSLDVPGLNTANTFTGTQTIKRTLAMTTDDTGNAIINFFDEDGTTRTGDLYHASSDSTMRLEKRDSGGSVISSLYLGSGVIAVGPANAYLTFSGTGASSQRTALGLAIGTDVQAYDAGLQSIAGLTTAADKMIYTTASDAYTTTDLTSFARTILDDTDASTVRSTIGLGSIATQASSSVTITGGSISGITDLAIADGGTGASTASDARTNLGLGTSAIRDTGTSGGTIPLLNGSNTFSGSTTFSGSATFSSNIDISSIISLRGTNPILNFYNSGGTRTGNLYHSDSDSTLRLEKRDSGGSVISSLQLGNGVITLTNDAYFSFSSTGKAAQQDALDVVPGTDVMKQVTITGTTSQISVTNGDGVSGNPTISLPDFVDIGAAGGGSLSVGRPAANRTSRVVTGASIGAATTSNGTIVGSFMGSGESSQAPVEIGRVTQGAGNLLGWFAGNGSVGIISVDASGVVTYGTFCGVHWSQLMTSTSLLVGTILESVDEMCEWEGETNIQLPKTKVSDTQKSKAVYGVYSQTDEDGDILVASLGAYVIRIAPDQVVQVGDYIQSNGDGCGRVQEDDILRASTVAKVTSTHHSFDYDDGSYCVPCTLHCG